MERRELWENFLLGSNRKNFHVKNEFDHEFESSSELNGRHTSRINTNEDRRGVGSINTSTCQELADIIGGMVITSTPVCLVQRLRNINATILGHCTLPH